MKKLIFFALTFFALSTYAFSQESPEAATAESPEYGIIKAYNVLISDTLIVKKIEIIDKETEEIINTFMTVVRPDNSEVSVIDQLKDGVFTGTVKIFSDDILVVSWTSTEGVRGETIKNLDAPKLFEEKKGTGTEAAKGACTIRTVHDCVSYKIEDMNWIEYGACLITAPECYALLWAACTWDVCVKNKVYVNPIE